MQKRSEHHQRILRWAIVCVVPVLLWNALAWADTVTVAVASNFYPTLQDLAQEFERESGHAITPIAGSTGKLTAQIMQGAPFDVFLAADAERPHLLEQRGGAVRGTRFTYAIGSLVLWSPHADRVDEDARVLSERRFRYLALANPDLAPYGKAAEHVMRAMGVADVSPDRIVRGENVNQTFLFVSRGVADLGFVALSQVLQRPPGQRGSLWFPEPGRYPPIVQQGVVLRDSPAAREFMDFLQSPAAREMLSARGYLLP